MIRRKLLSFGGASCDYRVGAGALDELSPMLKGAVGTPKRALVVTDGDMAGTEGAAVRHALSDAGFSAVEAVSLAGRGDAASIACAQELFGAMERSGLTADDLLVVLGGADVCAVAQFCAAAWCGGTSTALIPTTLDAMVTVATATRPLDVGASREMLGTATHPDLVVADVSLLDAVPADELRPGYVELVSSAFMDSRRIWDAFGKQLDALLAGDGLAFVDALTQAQSSRLGVIKSANPSARSALQYGVTTARALRACLDAELPWYRLLAEGMRFEARLGVEAGRLPVDDMFEQDDRFEALGIEEIAFDIPVERFLSALRETRFKRSNRFMFSIPQIVGSIRYTVIDEDLLERHARAFLASRAGLLQGGFDC